MKVMVLTAGQTSAPIIFRQLRKFVHELTVGYEAGRRWQWLPASLGCVDLCNSRYPSLVQQWSHVLRRMLNDRPKLIISEGIQGLLTACIARLFYKVRVVYWAVDWFPCSKWAQLLDRLATKLADENWAASPRIEKLSGIPRKPVPFLYEAGMPPNTVMQKNMVYLGGIRASSNLFEAVQMAYRMGIDLHVLGRVLEDGIVEGITAWPHVKLFKDATYEQVRESLRTAKYGWAKYNGGWDNYSNHATSRKIREYIENSVIPILAPEHVDWDRFRFETCAEAYSMAKAQEETGRYEWLKAIEEANARLDRQEEAR